MKLVSSESVEKNRQKLEVEVEKEDFNRALNDVFLKRRGKIYVPGFRKGKAPRKFIEQYYGSQVFYEDAVNELYPKELDKAIDEAGIFVIEDKIDLDVKKLDENGFVFTAVVTTKPEVEIDGYKNIKIKKGLAEVSDADVEAELEKTREKNARMIPADDDKLIENGDIAVIDFEGTVVGQNEPFAGGTAENFSLKIGSGQFIDGFEEQVEGHKKSEKLEVKVTFPEGYHSEELKAKDAIFKVKVNEVKTKELPELDDEFAKDISQFDTLEDLKVDLKAKMLEKKSLEVEHEFEQKMIEEISKLVKADIPEAMFENEIDSKIKDFSYRLRIQKLSLEDFLKYTGNTAEKFRESFRENATQTVKFRLALEKIAEKEGLDPSEKEIEEEYQQIAKDHKIDLDKAKNLVLQKDLKIDISCKNAFDFLEKVVESK